MSLGNALAVLLVLSIIFFGGGLFVLDVLRYRRESLVARASAPLPFPDHDGKFPTGVYKARNPERSSPGFAAAPDGVPANSVRSGGHST